MVALVLTVVFIVVVGAIAFHAWKEEDGKPAQPAAQASPADAPPETLEGRMVAQLGSGEISRRQYRRAMEQIAARDEERHPFAVPRDSGPADA